MRAVNESFPHLRCVNEVDPKISGIAQLVMSLLLSVLFAPGHGAKTASCGQYVPP